MVSDSEADDCDCKEVKARDVELLVFLLAVYVLDDISHNQYESDGLKCKFEPYH